MNVLIVDDDGIKSQRISSILIKAGLRNDQIEIADTGLLARELLSKKQFDLLIVDILLPLRTNDTPDPRGGMNLLAEIEQSKRFFKPSHVLALTGYPNLKREFESKFNNGCWTVDSYDPSDSGWADRLHAKASYIQAQDADRPSYQSDLCVLTALSSPELSAVRALNWNWSGPEVFDGMSYVYRGEPISGLKAYALAAPRMGMVATAALTTKIIQRLRPKLIVMPGICAGYTDKCAVGDVIYADPVWDWQMGKYSSDAFQIAPDQIGGPANVTCQMEVLKSEDSWLTESWKSYQGAKPREIPRLQIGPVASGSSVLADASVAQTVRSQHRKTLGLDMELYGLYSAARDSDMPRPLAFGLKSVCDNADQYKNDAYQGYSAFMSAAAINEYLRRFGGELLKW